MAVVSYEEFFSIGRGHSLLGVDPSYTLFFTFAKFSERCNRRRVSGWIDAMSHAPVRIEGCLNVSSSAMMVCNSGDGSVKVCDHTMDPRINPLRVSLGRCRLDS